MFVKWQSLDSSISLHAIVKCSLFPFFFVGYSLGGGISGRVRALNLTVPLGSGRVGSDNLGYGPGSGFSFEPVQTSTSDLNMETWEEQGPFLVYMCTPLPYM